MKDDLVPTSHQPKPEVLMALSHRLSDALSLAVEAHDGQVRKSTNTAYVSHPMAVASLVLEYGGSEDQAIAGLLHDAIEDGGAAYAPEIAARFGPDVLALVEACSDGTAESKAKAITPAAKKADWRRRKLDYLQRLETEDLSALLVTACDKLHNARAIVADLKSIGLQVFDRFTAGREGTLWYYTQAEAVLRARQCPVADDLREVVERMHLLTHE
jgi:(p)ppGpp synthase/HD superfamily hydrolase